MQAVFATCSQHQCAFGGYNPDVIRRQLAQLVIALLAIFPAVADDLESIWDGAHRSTALDVALDDSNLWVATSWGIARYEIVNGIPRRVVTRPLPGNTAAVVVGSARVYVGSGSAVYALARGGEGEVLGTGTSPGSISDLTLVGSYLYAATSAGVVQFDLIDPDKPVASRTLSTSTGFAVRLAVVGTTLYAADGDASVEAYTIEVPSFPQGVGSFGSLPRTRAVSEAGGRLYVSDGQRTEIWFGTGAQVTMVGAVAAGGNAVVAEGSQFVYLAGDDRRLRAYDVSSASSPVKLFSSETGPVGGTVNQFLQLVMDGKRLYIAAGDAGMQTWDTSDFAAPFLLRAHDTSTGSSVVSFKGGAVAAREENGLLRYGVGSDGAISELASWDIDKVSTPLDATEATLLVATGTRLRRFDLSQNPPAETGSVALSGGIRSAVLHDAGAVAIQTDRSVWSIDFTAGTASQISLGTAAPLFVAADGRDVAFAEFGEEGTTTVLYYPEGNFGETPGTATFEGAATSGITLSARRVACFTFRGITLVDFSTGGAVSVIPGSNIGIARDIELSGTTLFLLMSSSLQVWDVVTREKTRDVGLEGSTTAVAHAAGESSAIVASSEGLAAIQYATGSPPPSLASIPAHSNRYFTTALMGDGMLHLFDGRDLATAPLDSAGIPGPGRVLKPDVAAIDVEAIGESVYFLTPDGNVRGLTVAGKEVASYRVDESPDQRILSMRAVAGALWVSVEVNCLSGGCEFRTIVLDPRGGLAKTAMMSGSAVDASEEGSEIWAIFEVPDEIRAIDASDPYHPVTTASTTSTGDPVSIARDTKRAAVYVLGDLLYVYGNTLNLTGQLLAQWSPDPSGRVGYIDQQVHVIGDCAVVTGRTFEPTVHEITSATVWNPQPVPGSRAAAVRSAVRNGTKLYLLSDYSLEIWSSTPVTTPRRRPVR